MAEEPVIYKGQEFSSKGDKDRFVLPARIRKLVSQSSGGRNELLVTIHPELQCLMGFGESYRDERAALIRSRAQDAFLKGEDFNADSQNNIFGDSIEVSFDNSGRMIIPAYLRRAAGITDTIFFYGFNETFLMWSPERLVRSESPRWQVARMICEAWLETNGAKAGGTKAGATRPGGSKPGNSKSGGK